MLRKVKLKRLLLLIIFCWVTLPAFSQNNIGVLAYYSGPPEPLDSFNVNELTHIIFCFGRLVGNKFTLRRARDTATLQRMVSLKSKNPKLKVIMSLGGWGGCATCSDVFSTHKGRKEFVESVKDLYDYFGTDGLDLDWEYPTIAGYPGHKHSLKDRKDFTKLVKQIRKLGYQYELSFAAGASQRYLDSAVEWKKVMKRVNYVNLMTYDMAGAGSRITGHHTNLLSTPQQPRSADFMVMALVKMGIPSRKLVMGAAFYGKIFGGVDSINNGLYQPGKFVRSVNYKLMSTVVSPDSGFVYHWDSVAEAPYLYNPSRKLFFTYDH